MSQYVAERAAGRCRSRGRLEGQEPPVRRPAGRRPGQASTHCVVGELGDDARRAASRRRRRAPRWCCWSRVMTTRSGSPYGVHDTSTRYGNARGPTPRSTRRAVEARRAHSETRRWRARPRGSGARAAAAPGAAGRRSTTRARASRRRARRAAASEVGDHQKPRERSSSSAATKSARPAGLEVVRRLGERRGRPPPSTRATRSDAAGDEGDVAAVGREPRVDHRARGRRGLATGAAARAPTA